MFRVRPAAFAPRPTPRSGVALIVTVIMLSVITFLAVAFLALSGREKGAVKTATAQTTARLASDTGIQQATGTLLTGLLLHTNLSAFDLLVSTNYINWEGFVNGSVSPTNVNFDHLWGNNTALNPDQGRQNLANLQYLPRPPVYILSRLYGTNDFRYYLDLNRNGRDDRTGWWGVTNLHATPPGPVVGTNGLYLSNYVVGDPQWVGGLERPELPHSSSNKFLYRYAYLVVPVGKTLDINYIHNQARTSGSMDNFGGGFFRNQGVGGWEINYAAFLYDLNTNSVYGWGLGNAGYFYDPLGGAPIQGNAFADAGALYRYRLNGTPGNTAYGLPTVATLYGPAATTPFQTDFVDDYTDDAAVMGTNGIISPSFGRVDNDAVNRPWVGADNPFHLFTTQDLFDPNKVDRGGGGMKFTDRLYACSTNATTYDQYTFYRLLSQLGTDSTPEDKLNLNYVNVGGLSVTNFIRWTDTNAVIAALGVRASELFFTNAADRLLRSYTEDWVSADYANFTNNFLTDRAFGVTNIPVFVSGRMVYSPAVHRVLQVAANLWDAQLNKQDPNPNYGPLPTVFAPRFAVSNNDVYISHYVEVARTNDLISATPFIWDLTATNTGKYVQPNDLIFGVPLVVGARKGLPNFNEHAMETVFTLTRKVQLVKSAPGGQEKINQTNQFFTLDAFIASGTEFWNSYASNYTRPVDIIVNNRMSMLLTNDLGVQIPKTVVTTGSMHIPLPGISAWYGWQEGVYRTNFLVPLRTNVVFMPVSCYVPSTGVFYDPANPVYDKDQRLIFPRWFLAVTNRLQAMIIDSSTRQIIDYVLLGDMNAQLDVTAFIGQDSSKTLFEGLWITNALGPNLVSGREGINQQIEVSRGNTGTTPFSEWNDHGTFPANRAAEIAKFAAFFTPGPGHSATYFDPETGRSFVGVNTNLEAVAPFSPSVKIGIPRNWQANDPLVHYIARDMLEVETANQFDRIIPPGRTNYPTLANIGSKNKRYKPWPSELGAADTDPDSFNLALKDPLVTRSDDWQFPTNAFPTVGWMGRIHRGTPWQTIYLKASDLGMAPEGLTANPVSPAIWASAEFKTFAEKWSSWSGNQNLTEGFYMRPVSDRVLFDVFTTALNDNATLGQLPVNQTNLAAWSALFSGVVTLTNVTTDDNLMAGKVSQFAPVVIEPAGLYDAFTPNTWPQLVRLVHGINAERSRTNKSGVLVHPAGWFEHAGDILSVPELTERSPFLSTNSAVKLKRGLSDVAYEWLPQQVMSLLRSSEPRFLIYSYGQALQPAENSIYTVTGPFFGLCTNYQITAEVAARAVVRVEGSPDPRNANHPDPKRRYPPRLVQESYNFLSPE